MRATLALNGLNMNDIKKPNKNSIILLQCKNANNAKNAKIRTYPVGIYLLKVNNKNSRTSCVICSKQTKKHRNDLIHMKTSKVQSCKLYNSQYIVLSTQTTNT